MTPLPSRSTPRRWILTDGGIDLSGDDVIGVAGPCVEGDPVEVMPVSEHEAAIGFERDQREQYREGWLLRGRQMNEDSARYGRLRRAADGLMAALDVYQDLAAPEVHVACTELEQVLKGEHR